MILLSDFLDFLSSGFDFLPFEFPFNFSNLVQ
jgi:hypothetical protein